MYRFNILWFNSICRKCFKFVFFDASAIMQRLMPNNFRTSHTGAYPSLKWSFPVSILLSVCNATQGLCTEDSTVTGTRMQLLKVHGRYVDVSVLLQNGFTPNLRHCYTEFSTDGIKTWALNLVSLEEKPEEQKSLPVLDYPPFGTN
jgi:hypothetical protein